MKMEHLHLLSMLGVSPAFPFLVTVACPLHRYFPSAITCQDDCHANCQSSSTDLRLALMIWIEAAVAALVDATLKQHCLLSFATLVNCCCCFSRPLSLQ